MILRWIRRTWHRIGPDRRVFVVQGDSVAVDIRTRHLYLAREDGEDWVIAMRCPCGCGDTLELMVLQNAVPRWDLCVSAEGHPTLSPSVHRTKKCKSHFFIRSGKVIWC